MGWKIGVLFHIFFKKTNRKVGLAKRWCPFGASKPRSFQFNYSGNGIAKWPLPFFVLRSQVLHLSIILKGLNWMAKMRIPFFLNMVLTCIDFLLQQELIIVNVPDFWDWFGQSWRTSGGLPYVILPSPVLFLMLPFQERWSRLWSMERKRPETRRRKMIS